MVCSSASPSASVGTSTMLTPASSRTSTSSASADEAKGTTIFVPWMTRSSPSAVAATAIPSASSVRPGSCQASVAMASPVAMRGSQAPCRSSDPARASSPPATTELASSGVGTSVRPSSSNTTIDSSAVMPEPPCSTGNVRPIRSMDASSRQAFGSKPTGSSSSSRSWSGSPYLAHRSRTASRSICCSGLSSRSMVGPSRAVGSGGRVRRSGRQGLRGSSRSPACARAGRRGRRARRRGRGRRWRARRRR